MGTTHYNYVARKTKTLACMPSRGRTHILMPLLRSCTYQRLATDAHMTSIVTDVHCVKHTERKGMFSFPQVNLILYCLSC